MTVKYTHVTEKALRRLWPERWIVAKDTARACDGLSLVDLEGDPQWVDWMMTSEAAAAALVSCEKCAVLRDQALEHYAPVET